MDRIDSIKKDSEIEILNIRLEVGNFKAFFILSILSIPVHFFFASIWSIVAIFELTAWV
jgi:hypothetical protein